MIRKILYLLVMVVISILPIIIHVHLSEEMRRLSTFVWSIYLIPNILIVIMYPKWKVAVGVACFYSLLKYGTYFWGEGFSSSIELIALFLESLMNGAILLTVTHFRMEHIRVLKKMQKLVIIDSLTGLYNRRYFDLILEKVIPYSQRENSPLILIMLDIDYFKKVNDHHGHQCGDEVLKQISNIIKTNVRSSDAYVRFGGEEFAIVLPNTEVGEGIRLAENIRKEVEQSSFTYKNERISITISMGLSKYQGEIVQEFIGKADKALYKAKENGRNQVIVT
ncbi:GGDEF domain-containing protein [Pseudoneobacillus sp. C159]